MTTPTSESPTRLSRRDWLAGAAAASLLSGLGGCHREEPTAKARVTVYVSLDRPFAEPILQLFQSETGVAVEARYDDEKDKSVGLTQRLITERADPTADVFWNNEPANTVWLARQGVFDIYRPPTADDIPAEFRDAAGHWVGFAARARVIAYNPAKLRGSSPPRTLSQLGVSPVPAHRAIVARPVAGTTATHVAATFALAGAEQARGLWSELKRRGVSFQGASNSDVARRVADGEFGVCLTDTDDVLSLRRQNKPIELLWPTGEQPWERTLVLPNTVGLIKDAPHRAAGQQLIDFLVGRQVERLLALGPGAQLPVRRDIEPPRELAGLARESWVVPDWEKLADAREPAAEFVRTTLLS